MFEVQMMFYLDLQNDDIDDIDDMNSTYRGEKMNFDKGMPSVPFRFSFYQHYSYNLLLIQLVDVVLWIRLFQSLDEIHVLIL